MPHVRQHLAQPNWVETALCLAGCIEEMVAPLMVLERAAKGTRNCSKAAQAKRLPGLALSGRTDAGVSAYGQVCFRAFEDAGASMRQRHPRARMSR